MLLLCGVMRLPLQVSPAFECFVDGRVHALLMLLLSDSGHCNYGALLAGPSWEGDLKVLDLNRSSLRRSSALIDQGLVTKVVLKYSGIGPSLRKRYSGNFLLD